MKVWVIVLLVIFVPMYLFVWGGAISYYFECKKKGYNRHYDWDDVLYWLFPPFGPLYFAFTMIWDSITEHIDEIRSHGGYRKYKAWKKQEAIEEEKRRIEREIKKKEDERIKTAYLNGELTRKELPREENGVDGFEFNPQMGLSVKFFEKVREIVYVEREYNERLNRFFMDHLDLRLYQKYKFIYLPNVFRELTNDGLIHYLFPNIKASENVDIKLDSSYPMQYLEYPEDSERIEQGMFFFDDSYNNHGAKYIKGDYFPLKEGTDEEIIEQLHAIVRVVHDKHNNAGLFCTTKKPETKEGTTDDFADELFYWTVSNDEVAGLIKEVREKIEKLREHGMAEKLILKLLEKEPKLSRLVITKDYRILLPDYNDMEIKMEPLVKAVYLLFLRHPEGIVFKCLPDYRKELAEVYQKIRPLGLNERAIQSIEDVTNPCLNSINEKCARIRGAFVSQFDERLAEHYFIVGNRGKEKKIALPRDLVIWV